MEKFISLKFFFEKGLEQLKFLNSLVHRGIFMSTWDKEGSTWNLWSQNCQTSRKVEPFKKKFKEISLRKTPSLHQVILPFTSMTQETWCKKNRGWKMKLSDFVEALDNQILIFRGFHIDLKVRVRISLWILLLAPSSLLKKILFCFSGNWVGYFTFWLLNMTTKEHIRNGFYNWTFTNHFLYKHFVNIGNIKILTKHTSKNFIWWSSSLSSDHSSNDRKIWRM